MVVIAGEGHTRSYAVPERVRRRGIAEQVSILPVYRRKLRDAKDEAADFLYVLTPGR
jgi:hypothetical protein